MCNIPPLMVARDHPRACGEKHKSIRAIVSTSGSPPRMRGKEFSRLCLKNDIGITPAHAGKSGAKPCEAQHNRDHPRACGEKNIEEWRILREAGSPPRMRGKEYLTTLHVCNIGITPAHAGKRSHHPEQRPDIWDHPRACGEKRRFGGFAPAGWGSPPRMRGKEQR